MGYFIPQGITNMQSWLVTIRVTDDGINDAGVNNEYLPEIDIVQMITTNALPMAGLNVKVLGIAKEQ